MRVGKGADKGHVRRWRPWTGDHLGFDTAAADGKGHFDTESHLHEARGIDTQQVGESVVVYHEAERSIRDLAAIHQRPQVQMSRGFQVRDKLFHCFGRRGRVSDRFRRHERMLTGAGRNVIADGCCDDPFQLRRRQAPTGWIRPLRDQAMRDVLA